MRPAINKYTRMQKLTSNRSISGDQLLPDHWEALYNIKKILEPLAEATFKLEYRGIYSNTGSLWQWLTKLNSLLTFMEK